MIDNILSLKIQIAICDDEEMVRKELANLIQKVLEREHISYILEEFDSGHDLLEHTSHQIDVLFLDMDLPQMDGIETGIRIMKENPFCKIVIASAREDRFKETYKVNPLRFISKPFAEDEIWDAIQAYRNQRIGMEEMEMFQERKTCLICQRDIQYIAAFNSYVEIMVNGTLYRRDISLNKIEKELEKRCFFRVHKSYIVNLFWITDVEEKQVFIGNIKIPLSRRKRKEFEEAYMRFDVKYR